MVIRLIGAACIITVCGGCGFFLAWQYTQEEKILRQFIEVIDYMECELQYHLTPMPVLCRQSAAQVNGLLRKVFLDLADELENQISPDVERCMYSAIGKIQEIPQKIRILLGQFGKQLGRFDLLGQIKGLNGVRQACQRNLKELDNNKAVRLRSYKTLGICAGAALVILFI